MPIASTHIIIYFSHISAVVGCHMIVSKTALLFMYVSINCYCVDILCYIVMIKFLSINCVGLCADRIVLELENCTRTIFVTIPAPFPWYCPHPTPSPQLLKFHPIAILVPTETFPVPTPFPMHLQICHETISNVHYEYKHTQTNTI